MLLPAIVFCLSFTAVFVALGMTATGLGSTLQDSRGTLDKIAGIVIIALGVLFLLTPFVPKLNREWRPDALISRPGSGGPLIAGAAFAFAWTPCIGPTLGAILTAASTQDNVGDGAVLLFFYSLGLSVPFLLTALAFTRAWTAFRWLRDRYILITAISGVDPHRDGDAAAHRRADAPEQRGPAGAGLARPQPVRRPLAMSSGRPPGPTAMIARTWRGTVRTADADHYAGYIRDTGFAEYGRTPGNRGAWLLRRDGDGTTEFVTLSLWQSLEAVRAFAGDDIEAAVLYPEDERHLIDGGADIRHFEVVEQIAGPGRLGAAHIVSGADTPSRSSERAMTRCAATDRRDPERLERLGLRADHAAVAVEGRERLRGLERVGRDPVRRVPVGGLGDLGREGQQLLDQLALGGLSASPARGAASAAATRSSPALRSSDAIRACAYWM